MKGKIKSISSKGYGFIREETSGNEHFFHSSCCLDSFDEMKDLHEGGVKVYVEFDAVKSDKGPRAENVRRL